jgi:hypothetical protein
MAARRSSVSPGDGDVPTADESSFSIIRPRRSPHAKTCRDLPALNPHLPGHNLIAHPFRAPGGKKPIGSKQATGASVFWNFGSGQATPPFTPTPTPATISLSSTAVHAHTYGAFPVKARGPCIGREPYIAVQDLGIICRWIIDLRRVIQPLS